MTVAPPPDQQPIGSQLAPPSSESSGIVTGALLPSDLTVRLIRADNSHAEIYLSILFSISLTLFGVFLGSWFTKAYSSPRQYLTPLEATVIIVLGLFSIAFIAAWAVIKHKQLAKSVNIPIERLKDLQSSKD